MRRIGDAEAATHLLVLSKIFACAATAGCEWMKEEMGLPTEATSSPRLFIKVLLRNRRRGGMSSERSKAASHDGRAWGEMAAIER